MAVALLLFITGFYWLDDQRLHRNLFYLLIPIALFCQLRLEFWKSFFRVGLVWVVLAYMGYQAVSLSWSEIFSGEELGEVFRKSALVLMFVALVAAITNKGLQPKGLILLIGFAALAALIASMDYLLMADPPERMTGLGRGRNPIQSAALYGTALLVAGYAFAQKQEFAVLSRLFIALCWLVLLAALVLTESRGALLAALIAQCGLLLWLMPRRWALGSVLVIAVTATIAILGFVDWQSWLARADSFRLEIWQQIFDLVGDHWLLGLGYRTPFSMTLSNGQFIAQPHSIYVTAYYFGGIVGLLLLSDLWSFTFWYLCKSRQPHRVLAVALAVYALIFALVDFSTLLVNAEIEWLLFWLPVGMAVGIAMSQPKSEAHR